MQLSDQQLDTMYDELEDAKADQQLAQLIRDNDTASQDY